MRLTWLLACALIVGLVACREAVDLPNPYTDGGVRLTPADAGPVPDGAAGAPCPIQGCHPELVAVAESDGGCVCRWPCAPAGPTPRCEGWEVCAQLQQPLDDGGTALLDAGVCLSAGAPGDPCSPAPCAEILRCALLDSQDAGSTCRYTCSPGPDAAVSDATGADLVPTPGSCPAGQRCYNMGNDAGACFTP